MLTVAEPWPGAPPFPTYDTFASPEGGTSSSETKMTFDRYARRANQRHECKYTQDRAPNSRTRLESIQQARSFHLGYDYAATRSSRRCQAALVSCVFFVSGRARYCRARYFAK